MEQEPRILRYLVIGAILVLGTLWSLSLATVQGADSRYPNGSILATAEWLAEHRGDEGLVIVDVRTDDKFDGTVIPGAIRLPWTEFRYDDAAANLAEMFVGVGRAQEVLGSHGVGRADTVVLYDSVARDGGATAAYVFWVLEVLGHESKRVLEGGIDAWKAAGHDVDSTPVTRPAILYQAPFDAIRRGELVDGRFLLERLGDPFYQIIDVRSPEEYSGQKGSKDLRGRDNKLGHVPTAVNVNYKSNWIDETSKMLKSYADLQELYRGLDPDRGVVVYCDSGRRSSFSYFILKLMGIENVWTYEASWKEWGNPDKFFPVETTERKFAGSELPGATGGKGTAGTKTIDERQGRAGGGAGAKASGGYVSCGG
jgi:thiosulfate/3-mercaptopyruvate sulfurtransferase